MLSDVKTLLGIVDDAQDDKLMTIISSVEARLCILLGCAFVPDELGSVVTEVAVARFNRIGSEGLSSHTVEGETMTWGDGDEFAPFMDVIQAYIDEADASKRGRVRFL